MTDPSRLNLLPSSQPSMLQPVEITANNHLMHKAFVVEFPSNPLFRALVVRFDGLYGRAPESAQNALYMEAITSAYFFYTRPWGLIFDFRKLDYDTGSDLGNLLYMGRKLLPNEKLPIAILKSPANAEALRRLLVERGWSTRILFNDLQDALKFVDRAHWTQGLRQEMPETVDAE